MLFSIHRLKVLRALCDCVSTAFIKSSNRKANEFRIPHKRKTTQQRYDDKNHSKSLYGCLILKVMGTMFVRI